MTPLDAAWLAGLLEGEGCFQLHRLTAFVTVTMTDRDVVDRAAALMQAASVTTRTPARGKPTYTSAVSGQRAVDIMESIRPLMGARRADKIDAILTVWYATRFTACRGCGIEFTRDRNKQYHSAACRVANHKASRSTA